MRRRWGALGTAALSASLLPLVLLAPPPGGGSGAPAPVDHVVVYEANADRAAVRAGLEAAGGEVRRELAGPATALVRASSPDFAERAARLPGVVGVARDRAIGRVSGEPLAPRPPTGAPGFAPATGSVATSVATSGAGSARPGGHGGLGGLGGLAGQAVDDGSEGSRWHDVMVATALAHRVEQGRADVLVGIVDTGVDASHPELAGALDVALGRNFTRDDPLVDGACETDPDGSCDDPADVDENGHGTHVAGIVAAAADGRGTVGVAPGVRLVSLRAGQDSGYFFLQPVLEALAHAAEIGVDVVNLSFFVDPWLFNCPANPRDTAAEQAEQRAVIAAVSNALDHLHRNGVLVVAALGNHHADLAHPATDVASPVYPPGSGRMRWVDDSCLSVPAELDHVIGVVGLGPSGKKADYANHGEGVADLAAPGGYLGDLVGTPRYLTRQNMVLAPYPAGAASARGLLGASGEPTGPEVVRDCAGGACAYYAYLQGTSMAAPHVAGVAALVVSRAAGRDPGGPARRMAPEEVEAVLLDTARDVACPGPIVSYALEARPTAYDALCIGGPARNSIYGEGIVDAAAAVGARTPASAPAGSRAPAERGGR